MQAAVPRDLCRMSPLAATAAVPRARLSTRRGPSSSHPGEFGSAAWVLIEAQASGNFPNTRYCFCMCCLGVSIPGHFGQSSPAAIRSQTCTVASNTTVLDGWCGVGSTTPCMQVRQIRRTPGPYTAWTLPRPSRSALQMALRFAASR